MVTGVGQVLAGTLLLYDALRADFRRVRLRPARSDCEACAGGKYAASRLAQVGGPAQYDYAAFTGGQALAEGRAPVQLLPPERRIDCATLRHLLAPQVALEAAHSKDAAADATAKQGAACLPQNQNAAANGAASTGGHEEDAGRVLVLDVRAEALFQASRLPGSFNVPWPQVGTACRALIQKPAIAHLRLRLQKHL